ncbi:ketosteroid isomerase-related protein [Oceanobacter kriegii]|uniref:ketosteroid isomerase-related protein n=1 Tax=Oceanobacter kriegii TaxID=64972 RepID=UPI000405F832|nr:ketosteroid isomerase-related protein [Oceanobacter kriegii]
MSRSSTEALIFDYYQAFNRGDMEAFLALLTDDVIHDINQGGREQGKQAFALFMEKMNSSYKEELKNIVIMSSGDGDRAAAEFVVHGEYLQTDEGLPEARGQSYVLPAGAFFEVRGNKVARVSNYYNLDDWIAQVKEAG